MRILIIFILFFTPKLFGQEQNVLFIGNSYTHYNNMPKIFEKISNSKGKSVYADTIAVSNSTLKEHAQRSSTYTKLKSKKWNVVIIQGFSREFAKDSLTIATESIPYVGQLIDSARKYNPCSQIYYYMTWGYQDGFSEDSTLNTNEKMFERVKKGYLQLQQTYPYPIIPVGLVWQELRTKHPEINLFQKDLQHPNLEGSFTIASCFYSSLYSAPIDGCYVSPKLNPEYIHPIGETVYATLQNNMALFKLDSLPLAINPPKPKLDFSISESWTNIQIKNNSDKNLSYVWYFGDGSSSILPNPKYYYPNPGTYTVTLKANDGCNTYELKKKITVSKKEQFATSKPKPKTQQKSK